MDFEDQKQTIIRDEYNRSASSYDEEWSYYVKSTTVETLQRLDLTGDERILDVGCGTGYLLRMLGSLGFSGEVVGADLSPEMLKTAKAKSDSTTNYVSARSETLPFEKNAFSSIITCNAFHFFVDPDAFLAEAHRVLEPGGSLYITDWNDEYWACWYCDYYLRLTDPAHTKVYGPDELHSLLEANEFRVKDFDSYKIDWLWGLMTVKARK